jgi:hypothetical protein
MNNPPCGPFDRLTVPSLPRDFDSGPSRPPLRAGLEQGAKHRVETCTEETIFLAGAYSRGYQLRE